MHGKRMALILFRLWLKIERTEMRMAGIVVGAKE